MSLEANRIVGANDTGKRSEKDFYPTPPEVTQVLLDFLQIGKDSVIWECACGKGDMADVIQSNGYKVIRTDIAYGEDFLTMDKKEECTHIITNPPFSLADQFIMRAWEHRVPFALLLKSQYWHAAKRYELFRKCPPFFILPLTWRPDFHGGGAPLMDMMWCYWEPMFKIETGLSHPHYIPLKKPEKRSKCDV